MYYSNIFFALVLLLFFMLLLGFGGENSVDRAGMGTEEDGTQILVFLEALKQGQTAA